MAVAHSTLPTPTSQSRAPGRAAHRLAQASLEMTVAMIGAILLLFGSLKLFLWLNERLVTRHQHYEATRVSGGPWQEPSTPLRIFNE